MSKVLIGIDRNPVSATMIKDKNTFKPTIGLEVHIELSTKSKMFCGCVNTHFGVKPNTHTCPVCLGLPGALPVPNRKAVDWTLMIGLAIGGSVNKESKFDRKHYFYPDLPKGYQISQYDEPFCTGGLIDTTEGKVGITRVHLEEDTGKLLHKRIKGKEVTLIDFNRSGVPLVEVVTDPDIHSAKQAKKVAQKIRCLIRWLGVSDCDMDKGSMRLEANISLQKLQTPSGLVVKTPKLPDYKVEVKNINSFRFLERAINYEIKRQEKLLSSNKKVSQETRGWDEIENRTRSQRYKESASDYRYFPEPDTPPMQFSGSFINKISDELPQLPEEYEKKFREKYRLSDQYAKVLSQDSRIANYSDKAFDLALKKKIDAKVVAGYIVNKRINIAKINSQSLIDKIEKQTKAKVIDSEILIKWVEQALTLLPAAAEDYRQGKLNAISVLIGEVMKLSKGKADAVEVKKILETKLRSNKR
ncbi:MAG: Asp-tRNA(Asn)/Glu-tRNA(Gln) amidotransferase subunit GatB [Patescibacteria group bacterium]